MHIRPLTQRIHRQISHIRQSLRRTRNYDSEECSVSTASDSDNSLPKKYRLERSVSPSTSTETDKEELSDSDILPNAYKTESGCSSGDDDRLSEMSDEEQKIVQIRRRRQWERVRHKLESELALIESWNAVKEQRYIFSLL
jgi:hypothetical protein